MTRLHELAEKWHSDKLYWHSYIPIYEQLLEGRTIRRMIELGIGHKDLMQPMLPEGIDYIHGSSLYMWHDLWPNAGIFACDLREDTLINDDDKQIWSTVCDQSRYVDLQHLLQWSGGSFDLVIDDGSHIYEHQRFTAAVLLRFVEVGGLYIIEDVWPDKGEELAKEFGGELWRGDKGRDDNLVIIRR